MTIEKLERVMWRLRKQNPGIKKPLWIEVRRAIMYECGTSYAAFKDNRRALVLLGWIKSHNKIRCRITDKDLEAA